jgi:uncharacterized repeat protein (TIGR02543 family)
MTLYFETENQFPPAGNAGIYYVSKRTAVVYTYERGHYIKVPIGAANHIAPNYDGDLPDTPVCYMILLDGQGGTPSFSGLADIAGTWLQQPPAPTKSGSTFSGWYTAATGGTLVVWPYQLASNTTFYARWS